MRTELRDELVELGARVSVVACDVANRDAVAELVDRLTAAGETIRGVFHAAGLPQLSPVHETTAEEFADVVAAKVSGARNLDELLGESVEAFVLFASIAGVWGSGGQGAYAAANAFLDALAQERRGRGLAATSIAWGLWDEVGMGAAPLADESIRHRGVPPMPPELAISALQQALDLDETALTVADVEWESFVQRFTALRSSPLLGDLPEVKSIVDAQAAARRENAAETGVWRQRLAGLSDAEQDRLLLELVRTHAAEILGHAGVDAIHPDRAFTQLGFDSLTAVELRGRLNAETGLPLPATLVFDQPTPAALAGHLRSELSGQAVEQAATTIVRGASDEPIAIVGMSCRFPGGSNDPEKFWDMLAEGRDPVREVPPDRWDAKLYLDTDRTAPGKAYTQHGAFIDDIAGWDAGFFGLSPQEAHRLDPQYRLLMEVVWEALEDAGIPAERLRGSRTGVFVGLIDSLQYSTRQLEADGPSCVRRPVLRSRQLAERRGRAHRLPARPARSRA